MYITKKNIINELYEFYELYDGEYNINQKDAKESGAPYGAERKRWTMKLYDGGVFLVNGETIVEEREADAQLLAGKKEAKKGTISYGILEAHNTGTDMENLKIKFDSITSHDLTYVGIIQTARASGMEKFPIPYILTCCHNSLCAVGGTINEDDHVFGLTAAKKYGGIYLPPHMGVIHQYMRETAAGCGRMILGSDSHTRYGALGTMAVGEGGGELVKQILEQTWDISYPEVVAVYLDGKPNPGIGPQDIAIAIVTAVFKNGYVKNKVMEFVGPGVSSMSTDYRNGIDVMTTETTCLTSVWRTDEDTKEYLRMHGRADDYRQLEPKRTAYYDGCIYIDLSTIHSMIAFPFHPSNGYEIRELNANMDDILYEVEEEANRLIKHPQLRLNLHEKVHDGALYAEQGIHRLTDSSPFAIQRGTSPTEKDPSRGTVSLSVWLLWTRVPWRQRRSIGDGSRRRTSSVTSTNVRSIHMTRKRMKTVYIKGSERPSRRKILYADRI